MLDKEKTKQEVIKRGKHYQKEFNLSEWEIVYKFEDIDTCGKLYINPEKHKARITLNLRLHNLEDFKDIGITLLHEFYHLLVYHLTILSFSKDTSNLIKVNDAWDDLGKIIDKFRILNERIEIKEFSR